VPACPLHRLVEAGALEQVVAATCSLVSANGPSVKISSASLILIVVASAAGRRRLPCRFTPELTVSSIQAANAAWASSSHFEARSGSAAWISM
jgi:hypothetical protein